MARLVPVLTAAVLVLAAAAPARAAVTIGSPLTRPAEGASGSCAVSSRCAWVPTAADDASALTAPFDGVVVRWRLRLDSGPATLRLRTVQPYGSGVGATATGGDVTAVAGDNSFATRLPIARGGRIALDGAAVPTAFHLAGSTGTLQRIQYTPPAFADGDVESVDATVSDELLLNADVERDADGDGYGDETQDACPGDAMRVALPCVTATIGSPLHAIPEAVTPCSQHPCAWMQLVAPAGVALAAPADGVLVRWRLRVLDPDEADAYALQVLRPAAGGGYEVVGLSSGGDPTVARPTFSSRLAVRAGDHLAWRESSGDSGGFARAGTGYEAGRFVPALGLGDDDEPVSYPSALQLLASADIEPDSDRDGYGDVSQDACPADATRNATCPIDVTTAVVAPASAVIGGAVEHVYTVRNLGPAPAAGAVAVVAPGGGTVAAPGSCTEEGAQRRCALGTLAPGGEAVVRVLLQRDDDGDLSSELRASATGTDAQPADNFSGATTTFTVAPVAPPLVAFVDRACGNPVLGTRDDELLVGTGFGDLLRGFDGRDLLRGLGGADCLEGGSGNDVLDGGNGADRLNGGLGRDRLNGGFGNDRLRGGLRNDRLSGGPGNDTLEPGPGADAVSGGPGNDTVSARDGVRERIDCGSGSDTARVDRRDRVIKCERVQRVRFVSPARAGGDETRPVKRV